MRLPRVLDVCQPAPRILVKEAQAAVTTSLRCLLEASSGFGLAL